MARFTLNQSTIKYFINNGTPTEFCPHKLYESYISRNSPIPTSLAMLYGKYFESKFIGGVAHGGDIVSDLPRKLVSKGTKKLNPNAIGDKRAAHIRVDEQVEIGKQKAIKYGIEYQAGNTQVKIYKRWHEDPNVILSGELDVFPTILSFPELPDKGIKAGKYLVLLDLKLTQNVSNDFGPFCWGDFPSMDHIQARHYSYLVRDVDFELNDKLNPGNNLRDLFSPIVQKMIKEDNDIFVYWVFGYNKDYSDIFEPYKMNKIRWSSYYETIRKSIAILEFEHKRQYPMNPSKQICDKCHVDTCEYFKAQFR